MRSARRTGIAGGCGWAGRGEQQPTDTQDGASWVCRGGGRGAGTTDAVAWSVIVTKNLKFKFIKIKLDQIILHSISIYDHINI